MAAGLVGALITIVGGDCQTFKLAKRSVNFWDFLGDIRKVGFSVVDCGNLSYSFVYLLKLYALQLIFMAGLVKLFTSFQKYTVLFPCLSGELIIILGVFGVYSDGCVVRMDAAQVRVRFEVSLFNIRVTLLRTPAGDEGFEATPFIKFISICCTISQSSDRDYLKCKKMDKITSKLHNETMLISDKVTKINQYEWGQQRGLLITTQNIHNLKKEDIKRSIPLKDILGVSVTTEAEGEEFVVHVHQDYDYRFISEKRDEYKKPLGTQRIRIFASKFLLDVLFRTCKIRIRHSAAKKVLLWQNGEINILN